MRSEESLVIRPGLATLLCRHMHFINALTTGQLLGDYGEAKSSQQDLPPPNLYKQFSNLPLLKQKTVKHTVLYILFK